MSDDEDDFMMSDAESYEFEFEDDDDDDGNDQDMSLDDDGEGAGDGDDEDSAESLYYRSKNIKQDDLEKALSLFSRISAIEGNGQELLEYKFKALKQTMKGLYKLDKRDVFLQTVQKLFELPLERLQRGYVEDSFTKMIDTYAGFEPDEQLTLYDTLLTNYTKSDRLVIKINLKKVQVLQELRRFDELFGILSMLHKKLETMPEMTKNAYLLELYAMEIQAYTETDDLSKLKDLYKKTLSVQSTIPHPRINAVIKECGGKMHMRDENYEQASDEFYESFKNYDEIGNQKKRVKLLQYLIVSSMLSNNEINKFESQETKYFLKEEDVLKFVRLLQHFESLDHTKFAKLYNELLESERDDSFMIQNLVKVEETLKVRILINYIKPFKKLSLEKVSNTLKISTENIEDIFLALRNRGEIPSVRLDLIDGIIFNEY